MTDAPARVSAALPAHGVARHSPPEIVALVVRAMQAIMGAKSLLMADRPTSADAFVFACRAASMAPVLPPPLHEAAIRRPNLAAYLSSMMDRCYRNLACECCIVPAHESEWAALPHEDAMRPPCVIEMKPPHTARPARQSHDLSAGFVSRKSSDFHSINVDFA